MIFGVAGGIAQYLEVDPVIIRIAFVLLTFLHGGGLLIYIICAIVMPREPLNFASSQENSQTNSEDKSTNKKKTKNEVLIGIILIILGVIFLLHSLIAVCMIDDIVPIGLIILGGWLVFNSIKKEEIVQ
jgi:phage shock protein C